ncbi:hypothetical protein IE53DRAFT_370592 [Violaceomyces palustris]|uniref:Uncharacterized protein n=1 Tax=Violaceomyces palustris TaxID=1673888 RepID=A0ACD0NRM1_9BASI|nr:hypothetical protein IE53DRAFT_370592 [Violaceomyces palustris]
MASSESPTTARGGSVNPMAFCHQCGIDIRPLMTPDPTCPRCNGQFVEVIESEDRHPQASDPLGLGEGFATLPFTFAEFRPASGDSDGTRSMPTNLGDGPAGRQPPEMATLVGRLLEGLGVLPPGPASQQGTRFGASGRATDGRRDSATDQRQQQEQRSRMPGLGQAQFGPVGVRWSVNIHNSSQEGASAQGQRADVSRETWHEAEDHDDLDDGWVDEEPDDRPHGRTSAEDAESRNRETRDGPSRVRHINEVPSFESFFNLGRREQGDGARGRGEEEHVHDDGMGGAGGASDGRFFNYDNRWSGARPEGEQQDYGWSPFGDLLSGLLNGGGRADQTSFVAGPMGMRELLNLMMAGAAGAGRGQFGDYVIGQQGLDDIITQLMEQTQSSNAPPPANEAEIAELERFKRTEEARIQRAKNQECPTCKDDFLPSKTEPDQKNDEDPPEPDLMEEEDQQRQDELISMPCAHIFHEDCLVPWLKTNGTCPVCRVSIVKLKEGDPRARQDQGHAPERDQSSNTTTTSSHADQLPRIPGAFSFDSVLSGGRSDPSLDSVDGGLDQSIGRQGEGEQQFGGGGHGEPAEEMRERVRSAAEGRVASANRARQESPAASPGQDQSVRRGEQSGSRTDWLEPDELD